MTKLQSLLKNLGACKEAVEFVGKKALQDAWIDCERPDWMLWLAGKMANQEGWPTKKQVVLAACACAENVLPMFEKKYPADNRPRKAIKTAKLWATNKATLKKARTAALAAADAAYAAYAAHAAHAAYAADAATNAAAYAAYAAAADAADAAYTAAYAATNAATVKEARLNMAKIIRSILNVPKL